MAPKVFFVTGASSGLGQELVSEILRNGDRVVATARNPQTLQFPNSTAQNLLALPLELTDAASIEKAFDAAVAAFQRIDVVVNNAGYGLCGVFEDYDEWQIRKQMDVNFFGAVAVTRKALQVLKTQKPAGGLIQQISSMAGQKGMPTFSIYCASKWALEGFSEAVAAEVKPEWGIKFTLVEPGGFRTNWAGGSMAFAEKRHQEYDHIDAEGHMNKRQGTQNGDPVKGGKALYSLATMKNPPPRIALGTECLQIVMKKVEEYKKVYNTHTDITESTDIN